MKKEGWLFFLLSHHRPSNLDRTIQIKIGKKEVYLCARCSGTLIGLISSIWLVGFFSSLASFILMSLSPIPLLTDWVTQTLEWRKSNNKIRIITGFMLGIGLGMFISFLIGGFSLFFLGSLFYLALVYLSLYLIDRKTNLIKKYVSSKFEGQPPPWRDPP